MKSGPHTDYRAMFAERDHVVLYRQGQTNHCPDCSGSAWHVGRQSAECARCATAIPLFSPVITGLTTEG